MKVTKAKHGSRISVSTRLGNNNSSFTQFPVLVFRKVSKFYSSLWAKALHKRQKWQKEIAMNVKQNRGRFAATLATLVIAITLAACGGGGGGGETTVPPVAKDAVVSIDSTNPAQGATGILVATKTLTVNYTVSVGTYESSTASLTCGGTNVGGSLVLGVFTPSANLPYGTCSFQGTVTGKGVNGGASVTKNFNVTFATEVAPVVLRYPLRAIAVRYGRPGIMTQSAPWTEATNLTSYQTGAIPIFNTMVSEAPLANGYFLEVVWAASDSSPHIVQHNPITNVVTNFVGVAPAGYEVTRVGSTWTFGPKWHASPWGKAPYSYMSAWAQDATGGYFWTDYTDGKVERYQSATGVQSVLYTSQDGGAFSVMVSISN